MYLRKIRPRTTCLYSAASMLLRSASAEAQSLASKPRLAVVSWFLVFVFAMNQAGCPSTMVVRPCDWKADPTIPPGTCELQVRWVATPGGPAPGYHGGG